MDEKQTILTALEVSNLENMYMGDKARDARSKIRGFLFQDLVAISFLLESDTKYICTEFLEDIDVFKNNGEIEFVQVKYYTEKNADRKEIFTDLYYQYLRMKMLKKDSKYKASVVIATDKTVSKYSEEEMQSAVNLIAGSYLPKPVSVQADKAQAWLINNIYDKNKDEQKTTLFRSYSTNKKMKDFLPLVGIVKIKPDIEEYKEGIKVKLVNEFSVDVCERNKDILLGLAIMQIQEKYSVNSDKLSDYLISQKDFYEYLEKNINTEQSIGAYLVTTIHDIYTELESDIMDDVSDEILEKLRIIADNTIKWISNLCKNIKGQYQLINTLSFKRKIHIQEFCKKTVEERLVDIAECRENFKTFFKYLWKILLDINVNNEKDSEGKFDEKRLKPESYINPLVTEYISIKFLNGREIELLLPSIASDPATNWKRVYERMGMEKEKPTQYYMPGQYRGTYSYTQKVTEIMSNKRVTNPFIDDKYNIECMECINIDWNQWNILENCKECIFSNKCKKD